jgi:plasmid stability protein
MRSHLHLRTSNVFCSLTLASSAESDTNLVFPARLALMAFMAAAVAGGSPGRKRQAADGGVCAQAPALLARASNAINLPMAQLVVRNIEEKVVAALRQRAARHGVSMEEEHRMILRDTLARGGRRERRSFKDHLANMPDVGGDALFARPTAGLRRIRL